MYPSSPDINLFNLNVFYGELSNPAADTAEMRWVLFSLHMGNTRILHEILVKPLKRKLVLSHYIKNKQTNSVAYVDYPALSIIEYSWNSHAVYFDVNGSVQL
jgi:hypothetical protein